jgi:uncharacterized protein YbcI
MRDVDVRSGQQGTVAAGISTAIVRLMHEYTGRGPTKARTSISRDSVLVLLQDTLTKAERSLVEAGKTDLVLRMRQEFQRTMRDDFVAAVQMLTERKVIGFMSDNHIDPDMAAEVFVLEPRAEDEAQSAESDAPAS